MLLEKRFQDEQDVKDSGKDKKEKYEFDRIADGVRCKEAFPQRRVQENSQGSEYAF